jgi:hypothetical protein
MCETEAAYTSARFTVMIRVPDTESILASSFKLLTRFIIHDSASLYLMFSFSARILFIA